MSLKNFKSVFGGLRIKSVRTSGGVARCIISPGSLALFKWSLKRERALFLTCYSKDLFVVSSFSSG